MIQQQSYSSRNHLLGHHNAVSSPKSIVPTTSGLRTGPVSYKPLTQNTQSHLVQGFQQASYQTQRISGDRNGLVTRVSHDSATPIPGFLVSVQGERQVDFKTVGEDFMRIKDISSEYCYKFRVTTQVPSVQLHATDSLRLLLTFSGDYIDDLFKFVTALDDSRFSFRQAERVAVLEFRFTAIEFKNQLIEIIQSVGRRGSLTHIQTAPSLGNYRSVSSIVNQQVLEHQPITIQTINQGHRSQRSNLERVQHVAVNQITDAGVNPYKRLDVQPPVQLTPFPAPQTTYPIIQQTTQETFVQRVSEPVVVQQVGSVSYESTEVIRLTEENRILNSTIRSIQQDSQLLVQQNTKLQVQITNLRQQIDSFKIEVSSKTHYNEGEAIRLKTQLTQVTSSLTAAEKRLREVQLQLSQSKTAEVQAKNEKQTLRISFTKQISELETKINIISGSSTSSSTEVTSLRRQYEEQKNSNSNLEIEIQRLRQLSGEAERNLIEYEQREKLLQQQFNYQFQQERNNLTIIIEERNQHIQLLEEQLYQARQSVGESAHIAHVEANAQFNTELEAERQKFIVEYEFLQLQKAKQIEVLTLRLEQVIAEDNRKFQTIQQLEDQLNNTIHSQDISRSNANFQAVEKMRAYYEEQITSTKTLYENEYIQLNEQIGYYQKLSEEYQSKYGALLDEFRALSANQKTQTVYESVTTSQNTNEIALRNQIAALEHERLQLISLVERYQFESQQRASYVVEHAPRREEYTEQVITYQSGGNTGNGNEVVERVIFKIGDNNEVVQTTTYKTEAQEQGTVEFESIERITTEITTGEEQSESIERVTYQQLNGRDQEVTTYELDDGEERYIHKVTTDSIEGRRVHQIDTNIVVHQEGTELVYDIETEETNYGNRQQLEYQQGYSNYSGQQNYQVDQGYESRGYESQGYDSRGYQSQGYESRGYDQGYQNYEGLTESQARNQLYQEEAHRAVQGYGHHFTHTEQEEVLYHGGNVEVVYDSNNENIIIEGADYEINIPQGGAKKITITEETYQEMDNLF